MPGVHRIKHVIEHRPVRIRRPIAGDPGLAFNVIAPIKHLDTGETTCKRWYIKGYACMYLNSKRILKKGPG